MSRKRSNYRPKCAPGQIPVTIRCFSEVDLGVPVHMALAHYSSEGDWHTLASRLNWGCFAAARFEGVKVQLLPAMQALSETRGFTVLTDDQRKKIAEGLAICDQMEQSMTRREIRDDLRDMLSENARLRKTK